MVADKVKPGGQGPGRIISRDPNRPGDLHDSALQSEVWLAFWQAEEMAELDISQVDVIVRQGEVWLSGKVTDAQQQHLAECLVNGLEGVCGCHNDLQIIKKISQPTNPAG